MPLYSYKGRTFELPSGLTTEQAKAKIEGAVATDPSMLEPPQATEERPAKTRKFLKAAKAGASNMALTGLALTRGQVKDVDPEGALANIGYYGAGILADLPLYAAAAALAPATGGASLAGVAAKEVAKGGIKALASQAVKQAAVRTAAKGAAFGGGDQFLRYPLHAFVKDREYKPEEHLAATATGAAAGGLLGVAAEGGYGILKAPVTKWLAARTANALPPKLGALVAERAKLKTDLSRLLAEKKAPTDGLQQRLAIEQRLGEVEREIATDFPKIATKADPVQALTDMQKAQMVPTGAQAGHAERVLSDHASGLITEAEAIKELKALAKGDIPATSFISDISKSTARPVSARPTSPGKSAKAMSYQVAKDLSEYGYKVSKPSMISQILRNTERWDGIDAKFGTSLTTIPLKVSSATAKSTHFLKNSADAIAPIEQEITRLGMDPEVLRLAMKGEIVLSPEEMSVANRLTEVIAKAREVGIANGRDIGFHENYFPDRLKAGLSLGAPRAIPKKGVAPTAQKLTAEYHKKGLLENSTLAEKDPITAAKMYVSDIAHTHFDAVMPDIKKNWVQLQLLGQDQEAAHLLKTFADTTGMGRPSAVRLIASHFIKDGAFDVEKALEAANIKLTTDTADKVLNTAGNLMMENWIGPNIKTHVLQRMQNYLVGTAEIGLKYVREGSKLYKHLPENLKPAYDRALKELQVIDDVDLLERGLGGDSYKLPFGLEYARKPGKWLLGKFAAVETPNRMKMYLGARQQFLDNLHKIDDTLGGMLEGQRRSILDAMEQGGIEEAAHQYGLIRAVRTNFLFSAMDRPEILSGKLGRFVPFTSWTTNNWMRYFGDVKQGDYTTLAKRIVYPLAMLSVLEGVTGFKMPGGHPASGLTSIPEIAPFVTDPTALVPGAGIYQRGKKLFGKKPTTAGGFHPSKYPSLAFTLADLIKKTKLNKPTGPSK